MSRKTQINDLTQKIVIERIGGRGWGEWRKIRNVEVVWAELSTLSWVVLQAMAIHCMHVYGHF
jgi:hypothetical protein